MLLTLFMIRRRPALRSSGCRAFAMRMLSLILLCLMVSGRVCAFDLAEAWTQALSYSADYEAARYGRDAEREQRVQGRAGLLPQISANASYQRQPPTVSSATKVSGWNVQASQVLFDKEKWAQYRQGKLTAEMADEKLEAAEGQLLLDVAKAYFQVLLDADRLVAVEEEQKAYEYQVRQSVALFEKGAATIVDTHEAQAGYQAALAKKVGIMTELLVARNNLESLTGLDPLKIKAVKRRALPELLNGTQKNDWVLLAQKNNPEWRQQQLAVARAGQQLSGAKAGHWPKVTLAGGYQNNANTQSYYGTDQKYRSKGATVNVQLTIPLYSGGMTAGRVREAAALELQSRAQLTATERKIRLAVDQAYQSTMGGEYQIKAQKQLLKATEIKLKATKVGRSVGIRSNLDELKAQQEKADAEQKLAEAEYGYLVSYLELLKQAGLLTEKDLQRRLAAILY